MTIEGPPMTSNFDVFVVGAGVAGLAAAEGAAQRGLRVALAEETMFGGLVLNVNRLLPGLPDMPTAGCDLASGMMARLEALNVTTLFEPVTAVSAEQPDMIEIATPGGTHTTRSLIVASGARLRKLGVPGEAKFEHRGVSHCADCDAPLYKNTPVVAVGGGDSALQAALVLAEFASVVHLVHRGADFSGRAELAQAVRSSPRIHLHLETVVEAIEGEQLVSAVKLYHHPSGNATTVQCKGFFAYVGLEPNTSFLPPTAATEGGYVVVDKQLESSLPNVFAIGAARAGFGGQLTHAIDDARTAAEAVSQRLVPA